MVGRHPELTIVGGTDHDPSDQLGPKTPAKGIEVLMSLARKIQSGLVRPEHLMVLYTEQTADGFAPELEVVMTKNTTTADAYLLIGRLQNRITLLENARSGSAADILEE